MRLCGGSLAVLSAISFPKNLILEKGRGIDISRLLGKEVAGLVRPTWTEGHTLMLNLHVVTCLIVTMHSLLKTEQWSCTKRYITRMHNI